MSTDQEPVVFGQAIEALVKALKDRITPAFRLEAKARGVDLDKLQTAYSLNAWSDFLRALGQHTLGEIPEADRYRQLGRIFMQGFVETPLGLAALALAKLLGPRRALERMGRNFKQATNYLEAEFTEVGPKEVRLRTFTAPQYLARAGDNATMIAEYRQGLLLETLKLIGAKDGNVEVVERRPAEQGVTFRITWA